ncbi:MAG: hypothetical protein P1U65_08650 [Minwuia sp.]|nr:hypothetical protein [Minwuia sp.]
MRSFWTIIIGLLAMGFMAGTTAMAKPLDKATAFPLAVHLDYRAHALNINAMRLDCRVFADDGEAVGRGVAEWRFDPAYAYRRNSVDAVIPVILFKGAEPDGAKTCSCTARFDARSIFFRSGTDRFGQRPWMFARSHRFADQSCSPGSLPEAVEG